MKRAFLLPLALLLLSACTRRAMPVAGDPAPMTDCSTVMCTMDFWTVSIRVVDKAGKPVKLDSYKTVLTGKGTAVLTGDAGGVVTPGTYPVVTDGWAGGHKNTLTRMTFLGMIGGKTVVTEPFEIKVDCCHVSRASGKETVTVR